MATLVLDPRMEKELLNQRRTCGADRYDEVWEGVYRMAPMPNLEHQDITTGLAMVLGSVLKWSGAGRVQAGTNVSDRLADWEHNYRVPDVAVFLKEGKAKDCGTFWHGGADFVVEVASPGDDTREKIPFYAKIGTREMLIVERDPWLLELLRLEGEELKPAGRSDVPSSQAIVSQVIPFTFRLVAASPRPNIEVTSTESGQTWTV